MVHSIGALTYIAEGFPTICVMFRVSASLSFPKTPNLISQAPPCIHYHPYVLRTSKIDGPFPVPVSLPHSLLQNKVEDRNADYWRIVSTLEQEIPPAWVTHAARKRTKRLKAAHAAVTTPARPANSTTQFSSRNSYSPKPESASAATAAVKGRDVPGRESGDTDRIVAGGAGGAVSKSNHSRGPFQDRVDRVFFFGDLNYRVDLSREDIEMGVSVARRGDGRGDGGGWGAWTGSLGRKGERYDVLL